MAAEEQSDKIEAFVKQVEKWEIPEGDELLEYLNGDLRIHLERHVKFFRQCKSMERLGSVKELSQKISSLEQSSFFYIGYTDANDKTSLWGASPHSTGWEKHCGEDKDPVKIRTYFTHLNENDDQTKHDLIKEWKEKKKEQCLNGKNYGEKTKKGIVYVLVYEFVYSRKDVNRLCQKLKEGDMNDPAFREKIKKVKEVLGRQPEEESDSESDDGSITESQSS